MLHTKTNNVWRRRLEQVVLCGLLFFSYVLTASANMEVDWVQQFGGSENDEAQGISVVNGNVYVAGAVSSALSGQSYAGGGSDAYIRQYDSLGNLVWTEEFGTAGYDYATSLTADQNYVSVLGVTNSALFGPSIGGQDLFMRTYDANNGEILMSVQTGTNQSDTLDDAITDGYYLYVVGSTQGVFPGNTQIGSSDAYLNKYHVTGGGLIWSRHIGTVSADWAGAVEESASGVYVGGFTYGAFDGYTNQGDRDGFVTKYDKNGNVLWTNQFGTAQSDLVLGIVEEGGYVYVVGDTAGSFPGYTNQGEDDAFLRKYNASTGALVYTRQYGTAGYDEAAEVQADATGIYVTGFAEAALPGQTAIGGYDTYVRKYDFAGNELYTEQFGTTGGEDVWDTALDGGYIYVAGIVDGTWPGFTNGGGVDLDDAYIVRVSQDQDGDGIYDSVDTSVTSVSAGFSDGTTYGSVVTSGDQTLSIKDSLVGSEGVTVTASPSGGAAQAEVFACGISTFYLDAGDSVTITCGSVTFDVTGGAVRVVLYADDGRVAETTVATGNEVKFVSTDGSVTADVHNVDDVVLTAGNETVILNPGSVDEMPSDMPITVDSIVLAPAAMPVGSSSVLYATISSPIDEVSTITGLEYWVNTGAHMQAVAADGAFDEETEDVVIDLGTFAAAGVYEVCVSGTDSVANVSQTGCSMLAVYDPTGGYVTGGGQIESPAGAYVADQTLTGKAHFGFIAEYEEGAQTPTGNTQFRFQAGDLRFKSTSYDWLVVAGARAQYKGYGEIDKQAGYRFMLTAVDGDLLGQGASDDKFRMKIWDDATGTIVYDNQIGASDTTNLSTVITNGSIVIHTE